LEQSVSRIILQAGENLIFTPVLLVSLVAVEDEFLTEGPGDLVRQLAIRRDGNL